MFVKTKQNYIFLFIFATSKIFFFFGMKFFKVFLVVILLMVLSIAGYFGYKTYLKSRTSTDAFSAVPDDAFFVAQTNDLSKAWNDLSKSQFWAYLKTTEYFSDINEDIETVDKFLKDNAVTRKILENRELLACGMKTDNNWDMAYIIDLQEFSKYYDEISASLGLLSGYSLKKTLCRISQDNQYEIYTLTDKTDNTFQINLTLADNILIISLDRSVVEKVLKNFNTGYWAENSNFEFVSSELLTGNDVKFFVNFKQLDKIYSLYSAEKSESLDMICQSLVYSVMNLELFDDQIELSGRTSLDSVYSYLRAFASVDPGKTRAYEIISNQTALYFSLAFNDFKSFYDALIQEYIRGNKAEYDDMQKNISLVEKLLGISIQNDFLGWIGQEITIAKLRPLSEKSRDIDAAVLIQADKIDNAKAHLGNIITHLNKRTPVKFKIEAYRNFEINYLGLKGFFKMFFGKLFSKIEKPYFTYIEDYVVFANSQEVLKQIIDDYLQGRTMIKSTKFDNFKSCFNKKSNVTAYIQTPKLFETFLKYSTPEEKKDIENNRELINSFARLGFQLVNGGGLFKTKFAIQYDSTALSEDIALKTESLAENSLNIEDIDSLRFKVVLEDEALEDGPCNVLYDSIQKTHFEGNVLSNKANGIWRTYYESGYLFATANYQYGMLNGTAYFYRNAPGQKLMAEATYSADELNGYYIEYYNNGNIKAKIYYENGRRHGDCTYYYENGNMRYQCKYKKGERSGKAVVYNDKGKKIGKLDADNY